MEDVKKGEDNRMCSGLVTGLTGSAQDLNENDVIDSGFAGVFAEYDAEHNLIASYMMDVKKFIYRVYKYSFDGYYFE